MFKHFKSNKTIKNNFNSKTGFLIIERDKKIISHLVCWLPVGVKAHWFLVCRAMWYELTLSVILSGIMTWLALSWVVSFSSFWTSFQCLCSHTQNNPIAWNFSFIFLKAPLTVKWCWNLNFNYCLGWRGFEFVVPLSNVRGAWWHSG